MRPLGLLASVSVGLALATSGCCASYERALAVNKELAPRNRARVERAMKRTAALLGVELTAARAQNLSVPSWCPSAVLPELEPGRGCRTRESADGRVVEVTAADGARRTLVFFDSPHFHRVRLARRGDELFLLVPEFSRHVVGWGTRCECEDTSGGYTVPILTRTGFVVDSTGVGRIHEVRVPVTADVIDWRCSVIVHAAKHGGTGTTVE